MATIRIEKNKNYTVMSNYHLKEKEMSLKAKGLLSLMLSLPDDWDYSISGLVAICKENETAIKSTLLELKQFGYLEIIKKLPNETDTGRFEYEYIVYEQKQEGEKQGLENLPLEILPLENQVQLNTNTLNTKELNTNIIKENITKEIIDYLNLKANTRYKYNTPDTVKHIKARLNEGFTLEDFKKVIDVKVSKWLDDEKMNDYLRPKTLFGTKFEDYLNEKPKQKTNLTTKEIMELDIWN